MSRITSKKAQLEAFLTQPDILDLICEHECNGGSLIDLCEIYQVSYGKVIEWLYDKQYPDRQTRFEISMHAGGQFTVQRIIKEFKRLAFVDIRTIYDDDGSLKPIKEWPSEVAAAISSIESDELFSGSGGDKIQVGVTKKVKLESKLKALELLGKNLNMFVDRHEVSGKVTLEDLVTGSNTK